MWIVRLALNRPYTFVALALLILLLSPLVILRTPTDIFPNINLPVISVVWTYSGMPAEGVSQRIVMLSERGITSTVNDIEHIESESLNGRAVIKVYFHPDVDVASALAQVAAYTQAQLRGLPPGITPPFIIAYSASTVPVLQLGVSSSKMSEQQLYDVALNQVKVPLATVQGAAFPLPYGGKERLVSVDLDIPALQARGLSPVDVVNAVSSQNLVLPTGTVKLGPLEYDVELNGSPQTVNELNDIPVKVVNGVMVYLRDVAHVRDGYSPQTNIVRQNGVRGVMLNVLKHGNASTLDIVAGVHRVLQRLKPSLPADLKVEPLFDQSVFVRAAMGGVLREALIAACLTALMILMFLGDWRSTIIIAVSIPLSILTSILCLSALGQTINIMTLGGLALAVGILVDDATVTIENIDRHRAMGKDLRTAIEDGSHEIATPAFVSTLSICIVFVPMFFLTGIAHFLFVPLAEAVVFAMLASYFFSRTLVPTMAMYLLRGHEDEDGGERGMQGRLFACIGHSFENGIQRLRERYRDALAACLRHRAVFVTGFLGFCLLSLAFVPVLGRDFFPQVDAGQFRIHVRARAGLRIEETARLCDQIEKVLRREIPDDQRQTIIDNIGLPYSSINLTYSNSGTAGTSEGDILVALKPGHRPTADFVRHLREVLPQDFPGTEFFFQPTDMVSQILNFGKPAPIDVQVVGNHLESNYWIAQDVANRLRRIPGAVDVHVQQLMDQPTLFLNIDRSMARQVGLTEKDVAQNLLVSLSSSFQTSPSFWLDPKNGVNYNVAVQTPQYRVDSMQALMNTPLAPPNGVAPQQVLANLATVTPLLRPEMVSHDDVRPVIDVYANVQDRDLGGVSSDIRRVLGGIKDLPRGTQMRLTGQSETMDSSFAGLALGLAGSIVLVYLLIVVNFQSWLDPFIILTGLVGALAGIVWMLLVTHTTLSVPALTGAIMCMGVGAANSILVVSFARERLDQGADVLQAALEAGYTRIRPVLMTALAMIIGMLPMALGLGDGGEQNAPLGRAVVGGLLFATVATLFFVPVVFNLLHRNDRVREEGQES